MAKFMLLLHNDPDVWNKLSPEEMQKSIEKYGAWRQRAYVTEGHRLGDDLGKVMRERNGKTQTTDGPYSEGKEVLGGFYMIEAKDYAEAVQLSTGHPHLEWGGTIEVRQLWS